MMQRWGLVLLLSLLQTAVVYAEHWAVIVVGSRGFDNYRHQSDACHAYHVVRRHGIPAENVILMMYDDVATHKLNPFPNTLFNKPTSNSSDQAAVNVYDGCNVDYRGKDVTPEMFVNVLLGNKTATGGRKVLESQFEDRVFINFVDHGSRGYIVFPHGQSLRAKSLRTALQDMFHAKKYKELVFYMEACESGSMFSSHWLNSINAFVSTAANGYESSWGTYCPPHDIVNGTEIGSCLGDLYSVNWMEDSDRTDLSAETIQQQFDHVKQETTKSHVHEFGAKPIREEIVGNFQSNYDKEAVEFSQSDAVSSPQASVKQASAVDAHDIDLVTAFYRYLRADAGADRHALAKNLMHKIMQRKRADAIFTQLQTVISAMGLKKDKINPSEYSDDLEHCQHQVAQAFEATCGPGDDDIGYGMTAYSLQYAKVLASLCETRMDVPEAVRIVQQACESQLAASLFPSQLVELD